MNYPTEQLLVDQEVAIRVFNALSEGLAILVRDKNISYINPSVQAIIQRQQNRHAEVGDNYMTYVHQDRKEYTLNCIEQAFEGKSFFFEIYYPQSGNDYWIEIGYYPIVDEFGGINNICVKAKDVTEKVLLTKQLLKQEQEQNNAVFKAIIKTQETERNQIGRELHDDINQVLTTVKLYNEICLASEEVNKKALLKSVQQINYCIETIRALSRNLISPINQEKGLKDSLTELIDSFNVTNILQIKFFFYKIKEEMLCIELKTALYRICQEQLNNIVKHADASVVDIILVATGKTIALKIEDNGVGFNVAQKRKGKGVTNIKTRVDSLGGTLEIKSAVGEGCSIMIEFPLGK
ncbi:MAG: hypothetical protein C4330_13365 [Chitinophagaceae bacterium]